MKRALFPMIRPDQAEAERADLRRAIEADLPIVTPVWVAGPGGAAMQTTPVRQQKEPSDAET